jgi:hypothetical protein
MYVTEQVNRDISKSGLSLFLERTSEIIRETFEAFVGRHLSGTTNAHLLISKERL